VSAASRLIFIITKIKKNNKRRSRDACCRLR